MSENIFASMVTLTSIDMKTTWNKKRSIRPEEKFRVIMKLQKNVVGLGFHYSDTVNNRLEKLYEGKQEFYKVDRDPDYVYLDDCGYRKKHVRTGQEYMVYYPNLTGQKPKIAYFNADGEFLGNTVKQLENIPVQVYNEKTGETFTAKLKDFMPSGFGTVEPIKKQLNAGLEGDFQIEYRQVKVENVYYLKSGTVFVDRRNELKGDFKTCAYEMV